MCSWTNSRLVQTDILPHRQASRLTQTDRQTNTDRQADWHKQTGRLDRQKEKKAGRLTQTGRQTDTDRQTDQRDRHKEKKAGRQTNRQGSWQVGRQNYKQMEASRRQTDTQTDIPAQKLEAKVCKASSTSVMLGRVCSWGTQLRSKRTNSAAFWHSTRSDSSRSAWNTPQVQNCYICKELSPATLPLSFGLSSMFLLYWAAMTLNLFRTANVLAPPVEQAPHSGNFTIGVLVNTAKLKLVLKQTSFWLRERILDTFNALHPYQWKQDVQAEECQSSRCIGSNFPGWSERIWNWWLMMDGSSIQTKLRKRRRVKLWRKQLQW